MTPEERELQEVQDQQRVLRQHMRHLKEEMQTCREHQNILQHDLDYLGLKAINLEAKIARRSREARKAVSEWRPTKR